MYLTSSELEYAAFIIFGAIAVASAIIMVTQKDVYYSAIALAPLGFSVAGIIAVLAPQTYGIYSAFHILLYIGAAVVFLGVSLVMFRGIFIKERKVNWAIPVATLSFIIIVISLILPLSEISYGTVRSVSLEELGNIILLNYWFPIFILIVGLVTTLVEALALARRD
ncbi:MAG: NADH-quinone oxidoreductase subunit J [Sulfolobaceae archaeon]|nr:NADH-quinone oxidoreductase subunit J [Sulfolobaceae archaeon]